MAVIIKLNGIYIGATTMTTNEIRNAKNAGFTILTRKEKKDIVSIFVSEYIKAKEKKDEKDKGNN